MEELDNRFYRKPPNNKTSLKEKILFVIFIIVISFLLFLTVDAQTIQELDTRLKRVEDSLGIRKDTVIIPVDTAISFPVYQGIILNGNYDVYPSPYSSIYRDRDNYYKIFVQKSGKPYAVGSINGLNGWIYGSAGNAPRGSIIKDFQSNRYLCAYHKWFNGYSYFYFAGSFNSYEWGDMAFNRNPHGEDITILIDQGKYKAYGRMQVPPAVRTIGYMESSDFRVWTQLIEVLRPDALDGLRQFYSMTVIKGNYGYFGFLNVFDTGTDLVSVQLVWSENGIDNWQRLINRQDILIKKNGVKCLYACASVIGSEVWIATISSKFNHEETDRNGQYYFTELYKISLTELQKNLW